MQKRLLLFVTILLSSVLFYQCEGMFSTDIQKIVDDPEQYADKEVTVKGTVGNVTDLALIRYYKLEDETGEILVIAKGNLPYRGDKVTVTGKVNPVFKLGTIKVTVIEEVPKRN